MDHGNLFELAKYRWALLKAISPQRARLFGDDFAYGDESGPGTGGEWGEVCMELERAIAQGN